MVGIVARVHNGSEFITLPYVSRAVVKRTEAMHDYIQLYFNPASGSVVTKLPSAPLSIEIVTNVRRTSFNGYLDLSTPTRTEGVQDSTLSAMGVTHVLRNSSARSWANRLASDIVIEVLYPYRLGLEMDLCTTRIDFISQAQDESDWQLLTRLADRIGFSLSSQDIVVRMVDVQKEERRTPSGSFQTLVVPSSRVKKTNVTMFSVNTTTSPDDALYKDYVIRGVDSLGQKFTYRPGYVQSSADVPPEFAGQHPGAFTSLAQAMVEADRIVRQARWTHQAKAYCIGDRIVTPGRCVLVLDNDAEFGGYWFVTNTTTTFDSDSNQVTTEVVMCRDSTVPTRKRSPLSVPIARYPVARLINGRWQADRQWEKISA